MGQTGSKPESFETQAIELVDAMHARACEFPIVSQDNAAAAAAESAASAASTACVLLAMAGDDGISEANRDMLMDCARNASGAAMNAMRAARYLAPEAEVPTVRAEGVSIADMHGKPEEAEPIGMADILNRLECVDDMLGDALRDLNAWDRDVPGNDPAYYVVTVKNELLRLIWDVEKSIAA